MGCSNTMVPRFLCEFQKNQAGGIDNFSGGLKEKGQTVENYRSALISFYFSKYRMSIVATSARLAFPLGSRMPPPLPVMIPCSTAQRMASWA